MQKVMPTSGDKAWMWLIGYILMYDVIASLTGRDTLSQSFARALEDPIRKWPTTLTLAYIVAHLMRFIPEKWDPLRRWTSTMSSHG